MRKLSFFEPCQTTYSASTFPSKGYLEVPYPWEKTDVAHVNAPMMEKGDNMEEVHIPIGAGDHVLKTLLMRHPCKPKVTISTTNFPVNSLLEVEMRDYQNKVSMKKPLRIEDLMFFSKILDSMDEQIADFLEDFDREDDQWKGI